MVEASLTATPGTARIDAQLRSLIERMATENGLWGAPRIHGELLKLGLTVSERTVSRYLPDRRTRRSQTWRTFFANHIGTLAFTSTVTSSFATSDEDVDASVLLCRPVPASCAERYVSTQWAVVDGPPTHQPTSLGRCVAQDQRRRSTGTHFRSGKDRRGRVSSNPVLASPDWSSSRRLSRGRSSYSVRAGPILRRCIGISELCVTRFVILAREPTRPSLVELKRPSNTDAQSMVRHNSSPTDFSPRSE